MTKSKFSLVLRQCRENAGLTQKQVSDALNVERSTYAYYETGNTHPSCAFVVKVSKILGIDYKLLIDAVADENFDSNAENKNFTTLTPDSWEKREKMYTLSVEEQNVVLAYRSLSCEDKKEFFNELKTLQHKGEI